MVIHDTKVPGPVRPVTRTIDRRDDDSGFSSRVDDGLRSYSSGHNTIGEALRAIQGQTETLQICQLWDTVPGLQFRGQKEWGEALVAWKREQAAPVTVQKTWIGLFGPSARNCIVDGRHIARRVGPDNYQIIHTCDTHQQALDVMDAWLSEIASRKRADEQYIDANEAREFERCGIQ